jgi:hypothetical protein
VTSYTRAWFPIPGAHNCEGGMESVGESSWSILSSGHAAVPVVRPAGHARNRTLSAREYLGLKHVCPHQSLVMEIMPIRTCFRSVCYWNAGLHGTYMLAKKIALMYVKGPDYLWLKTNQECIFFCKKCLNKISYVNSV